MFYFGGYLRCFQTWWWKWIYTVRTVQF